MTPGRNLPARTASEAVAEQLRARIATRALEPGDMLPSETTLLDEFGVARPTMREALRILESDGLVTVRRGVHGGAQVTEPDLATLARRAGLHLQIRGVHMGDLMAALRVVQPGAVALAAQAATPAQIRELRSQIERVAAAEGVDALTDEATEFLHTVVQASGNQTLAFVSTLLNRLVRVEARAYVGEHSPAHGPDVEDEFRAWCVEQYSHLVDLIEAGEAQEAEAFWRRHLHLVPPAVDDASSLTVYEPLRR
jgi:DNA-binding FadR family transcriptional regulator